MKYWIITDTHFNHKQLIEYGRPKDFEEKIKAYLIFLIKPEDVLIHLGDVCIGKDADSNQWFKAFLKCRTILVKGNHDNKSHNWYMNNGWDIACDRFDMKYGGKKIAFTHMPVGWDGYFDMNIHGHLHDTNSKRNAEFDLNGYNKLLALEHTNYQPVNLTKFIN